MIRDYARLSFEGQTHHTHFRKQGSGRALVLLHPSPLSSAFMVPLMDLFKDLATVYAPDTPGYGMSDPLPQPDTDLSPYVEWLKSFIESRNLNSTGLYGSATGAQIAIEFTRTYPEMVDFVVLDNAVHFTDQERDSILQHYFPDLQPRADGSHFQKAWQMSDSLYRYFPWFDQSDASKISDVAAPVTLVHATALAYLQAGVDYDRAYRAAFNNEDAKNVQSLTRPTRIIRWQGSMLRKYADRMDDFKWPEHIRMAYCEADPVARMHTLKEVIGELAVPE